MQIRLESIRAGLERALKRTQRILGIPQLEPSMGGTEGDPGVVFVGEFPVGRRCWVGTDIMISNISKISKLLSTAWRG